MCMASSSFEFIRRVRLAELFRVRYAREKPHPRHISNKQLKRPIIRRAESIRFRAKYCPLIVSLHIDVGHQNSFHKYAPPKLHEPVVFALKELVRSCETLETLGIVGAAEWKGLDEDGNVDKFKDGWVHRDIELDLKVVSICLRDDATESWSRTTIREYIEHGPTIRFLSPEEWAKRGLDVITIDPDNSGW